MAAKRTTQIEEGVRAEQLEDLLSRWHHWQLGARVGRGFNDRAVVAGEHRTSRQYDDANGALYDDEESDRMRTFQANVDEITQRDGIAGAALYQLARARYVGVSVFNAPRLPTDPEARQRVLDGARGWLILRLVNAGLLE